jgi:hypothetical protein
MEKLICSDKALDVLMLNVRRKIGSIPNITALSRIQNEEVYCYCHAGSAESSVIFATQHHK